MMRLFKCVLLCSLLSSEALWAERLQSDVSGVPHSGRAKVSICHGAMHEGSHAHDRVNEPESAVLACIFDRQGFMLATQHKPWLRCIREAEHGLFAGVCPLSETLAERSAMQASDPLVIEKWYWMSMRPLTPVKTSRFAAIRGSNQHAWLLSKGLNVLIEATSITQLFDLLDSGRIDAIIATNHELTLAEQRGVTAQFVRYLPLRAYFTNQFLFQHSNFLDLFNAQIESCQSGPLVQLTDDDELKLDSYAHRYRNDLEKYIMPALQAQNVRHQALTHDDILRLDAVWSGADAPERNTLQDAVLKSSLSQQLRQLKQQSDGIIAELFVMDNRGLLLGSTDKSSDYWQGDEAKFTESYGRGKQDAFIDKVRFDRSSRMFLSQVSTALLDAQGSAIGAVMIGINVEQALTHLQGLE